MGAPTRRPQPPAQLRRTGHPAQGTGPPQRLLSRRPHGPSHRRPRVALPRGSHDEPTARCGGHAPQGDAQILVGDVVAQRGQAGGKGFEDRLRSALSATSRVAAGPAQALEVLGRYAHSLTGAESTTAVTAFIDFSRHLITYSSAGPPPPALLRGDGTVDLLDQATDPPLDAAFEPSPRPEATTAFTDGDTLLLYTDGLIERRHQDIDTGLSSRLTDALARHRALTHPEALADAVINDLIPAEASQTTPPWSSSAREATQSTKPPPNAMACFRERRS